MKRWILLHWFHLWASVCCYSVSSSEQRVLLQAWVDWEALLLITARSGVSSGPWSNILEHLDCKMNLCHTWLGLTAVELSLVLICRLLSGLISIIYKICCSDVKTHTCLPWFTFVALHLLVQKQISYFLNMIYSKCSTILHLHIFAFSAFTQLNPK